jgi:hypothetical protein
MCRCAERRAKIAEAGRAAVRGDRSKIGPAARFVVATSREDVAIAARKAFRFAVGAMRSSR